jgi:hypothetical protein
MLDNYVEPDIIVCERVAVSHETWDTMPRPTGKKRRG